MPKELNGVTAGADTSTGTTTETSSFDMGAASDQLGDDLLAGLGISPSEQERHAPDPKPVPVPSTEAAAETDTPDTNTDATPSETEATPPAGDTPPDSTAAPQTWRPEAQQAWASLPEVVRQEIVKREQDMFAGLEQYKVAAAEGAKYTEALAPFQTIFQTYGIDPAQQVAGLMNAHLTLTMGTPEQKQALVQQFVNDYGLSNIQLDTPYVDPAVSSLQSELRQVRMQLDAQRSQISRETEAKIQDDVAKFAADAKNVHFNTVYADMAQLLQSGVSTTLQDAYDKAVWANPVTRAAEIKRQQDAERQKQADVAAKARLKTGVTVKSTGSGGTATTGTMDDTMAEVLANIQARTA